MSNSGCRDDRKRWVVKGRVVQGNDHSLFRYVDLVEVTFPVSFGDNDIFMSLSKQSFGER
jgi:hypothetical protein